MKYILLIGWLLFAFTPIVAQEEVEFEEEEVEEVEEIHSSDKEIGVDLNFSASNFGGTGGLGLKLGFVKQERYIFGPSIRYQYSWSKGAVNGALTGINTSFSVYGAGGFVHARLANYFFVGAEVELLSTPFQNGYIAVKRVWAPVALVGGGFSRAFSENFRLNAGIMYDVINNVNSPFRQGYFMKNSLGKYIPVMYRIAFFFPF